MNTPSEPRMITNPRELINDVGLWAQRQPWHPTHAPDYGVVEEIGELYHCFLKHMQGLKGMDNLELFHKKVKDALGDIMVYLSHWCYLKNCYFTVSRGHHPKILQNASEEHVPLRNHGARICTFAGHMLSMQGEVSGNESVCGGIASNIANVCADIALAFGWDLMRDCVYPTWHHVRQRDWQKLIKLSAESQQAEKDRLEATVHGQGA